MISLEIMDRSPRYLDVPETITVRGNTVKGGIVEEDGNLYWQYTSPNGEEDWVIWFEMYSKKGDIYMRAMCDDENAWLLDDTVWYNVIPQYIEKAIADIEEYYKNKEEEE